MKKKRATTGSSDGGGGLIIEASNRKARRKEQRHAKKIKKQHQQQLEPPKKKQKFISSSSSSSEKISNRQVKFSNVVDEKIIPIKHTASIRTSMLERSRKQNPDTTENDESKNHSHPINKSSTHYDNLDDETAAALRRDDMEIEYLESSLGVRKRSKKGNRELNREYAKNEGFGDDFGDFLMGLDNLVERVVAGDVTDDDGGSESEGEDETDFDQSSNESIRDDDDLQKHNLDVSHESDGREPNSGDEIEHNMDLYANLDEEIALALRKDDAEIAELESKLGLASGDMKAKNKLNKEFAKSFSGYGEDFGDFLDDLDSLAYRVGVGGSSEIMDDESEEEQYITHSSGGESDDSKEYNNDSDSEQSQDSDASTVDVLRKDADHDVALTYRPTSGEDIYGNKIDSNNSNTAKPAKYIPPHLRKQIREESVDEGPNDHNAMMKSVVEAADPETIRLIQRSLNNSLNRLSDNTLESISKTVAALYSQYPFRDINTCLWKNIQLACIPSAMVMSGLIPLYIAAISGVHWIRGDKIQLGGCVVEWSVKQLYESLEKGRHRLTEESEVYEFVNKEASNALLVVCYLYNYGAVHCTLIYDIVKDLIENFSEIDVESLLIILSHCGQQLRSDDPSALREIILMVKDRAQREEDGMDESSCQNKADSSRVDFMLTTITELKNNKPRKQDVAIREKTSSYKKCLGRLKSSANNTFLGSKSTGTCLRISLQDILDAETKGRWWVMGASWAGNQKFVEEEDVEHEEKQNKSQNSHSKRESEEDKLLSLASSQRMNTDTRRSTFCIVMTSSDCNDAFAKLTRAELLKPKNERDVIRVLVHCCGEEKSFNPFYAHLIMRVCEYQPKSKFTLMLSFWDIFKQLDSFNDRKIANLAKLLSRLLSGTTEKYLTVGALKRIEFSPTSMPEQVVLFLTIVMSSLFDSSDSDLIRNLFSPDTGKKTTHKSSKQKRRRDVFDSDDEDNFNESTASKKEDLSELKESIATFLLQYVKSMPNNIEGTKWNENFSAAVESCKVKLP